MVHHSRKQIHGSLVPFLSLPTENAVRRRTSEPNPGVMASRSVLVSHFKQISKSAHVTSAVCTIGNFLPSNILIFVTTTRTSIGPNRTNFPRDAAPSCQTMRTLSFATQSNSLQACFEKKKLTKSKHSKVKAFFRRRRHIKLLQTVPGFD